MYLHTHARGWLVGWLIRVHVSKWAGRLAGGLGLAYPSEDRLYARHVKRVCDHNYTSETGRVGVQGPDPVRVADGVEREGLFQHIGRVDSPLVCWCVCACARTVTGRPGRV